MEDPPLLSPPAAAIVETPAASTTVVEAEEPQNPPPVKKEKRAYAPRKKSIKAKTKMGIADYVKIKLAELKMERDREEMRADQVRATLDRGIHMNSWMGNQDTLNQFLTEVENERAIILASPPEQISVTEKLRTRIRDEMVSAPDPVRRLEYSIKYKLSSIDNVIQQARNRSNLLQVIDLAMTSGSVSKDLVLKLFVDADDSVEEIGEEDEEEEEEENRRVLKKKK